MNMQRLLSAGTVNIMERTFIEVIINCLLEIIRLGPQQPRRGYITVYLLHLKQVSKRESKTESEKIIGDRENNQR